MKKFEMSKIALLTLVNAILLVSTEAEVSVTLSGVSPTREVVSVSGNVPEMGPETKHESGSRLDSGFTSASILDVSWKLNTGSGNVSQRCALDTSAMYSSLRNLTLWAFEMWDATAKQPLGYIHGSSYQLGNFDECLQPHDRVRGGVERQYCLADVTVDVKTSNTRRTEFRETFDPYGSVLDKLYYSGDKIRRRRDVIHWAMCVPASCSPADLELMMNRHFQVSSTTEDGSPVFRASVHASGCQVADLDKDISIGAIIYFAFFGILVLIVSACSIRHWYLITNKMGEEAKCSRLVQSYSVIHQLKRLGDIDDESPLDVLYGIKVLSICFIITDHRLGTTLGGPISNMEYIEKAYRSFEFAFVSHGDLLVDTFLVISGLLAIHGLQRKYSNRSINAPIFILMRFLRLVPAYAVTLMFSAFVLPLTGSGPLWGKVVWDAANCRIYWWTNLLMLSNYVHVDHMCMVHSWYIPVDFQLTVVFLLVWAALTSGTGVYRRMCAQKYVAPSLAVLLLAVSVLVPGVITYVMKLPAMLMFYDDFLINPQGDPVYQIMYVKTHNRAAPYILGLITGYLIYKYSEVKTKRQSMLKSAIGGVFALLLLFTAMASGYVFYLPTKEYSAVEAGIYAGLYRPVWATGVCLLVVCSVFGKIPIITRMLSWSPWKPLGKLVYGAYLVHLLFQLRSLTMSRQPVYLDGFAIIGTCLGDIVYSFSLSLLLYLTVEAPAKDLMTLLLLPRERDVDSVQDSQSSPGSSDKNLENPNFTPDDPTKLGEVNTITGIFIKNNNARPENDKNIV